MSASHGLRDISLVLRNWVRALSLANSFAGDLERLVFVFYHLRFCVFARNEHFSYSHEDTVAIRDAVYRFRHVTVQRGEAIDANDAVRAACWRVCIDMYDGGDHYYFVGRLSVSLTKGSSPAFSTTILVRGVSSRRYQDEAKSASNQNFKPKFHHTANHPIVIDMRVDLSRERIFYAQILSPAMQQLDAVTVDIKAWTAEQRKGQRLVPCVGCYNANMRFQIAPIDEGSFGNHDLDLHFDLMEQKNNKT